MAELCGHAEGATVELAVDHDGTAKTGAHGQRDHIGAAPAGTVHEFAPAGAVGIVFDDDRNGMVGQIVIDPGRNVGGEGERLAIRAHITGRGDADGLDISVAGGDGFAVDLGDVLVDGVGVHRRGDAPALDDAIVFIADIDGERGHGLLLEDFRNVRDSENSSEPP